MARKVDLTNPLFRCHKCDKGYKRRFWFDLHLSMHSKKTKFYGMFLSIFISFLYFLVGSWKEKPNLIIKSIGCPKNKSWECNLVIENVGKSTVQKHWVKLVSSSPPILIVRNEIPPNEPQHIYFDPLPPEWSSHRETMYDEVNSGNKGIIISAAIFYRWKFIFWDIPFSSNEYSIIITNSSAHLAKENKRPPFQEEPHK